MVCDDVGAFLLPKMIFRKMMRVCVFAAHLASFLEDALYGRVVRADRAPGGRRAEPGGSPGGGLRSAVDGQLSVSRPTPEPMNTLEAASAKTVLHAPGQRDAKEFEPSPQGRCSERAEEGSRSG